MTRRAGAIGTVILAVLGFVFSAVGAATDWSWWVWALLVPAATVAAVITLWAAFVTDPDQGRGGPPAPLPPASFEGKSLDLSDVYSEAASVGRAKGRVKASRIRHRPRAGE